MPSVEHLNLFHARFFMSSNGAAVNVVMPKKPGTYWVIAAHPHAPIMAYTPLAPMRMYCAERDGHSTWHEIDDNGNICPDNTNLVVLMWIEPNHEKAEKRRVTSHGGNHIA